MSIKIKRVYEKPAAEDGFRILIDRLWPRGLTKEKAAVDLWLKEIAPSADLRKWFNHDPKKWAEFKERYHKEIMQNKEALNVIKDQLKKGNTTLVYGARDEEHNDAVVLLNELKKK